MAEDFYIGVDGQARRVVSAYVGVDGVAREITGGYVGIDGTAKPFFSGGKIELLDRLDFTYGFSDGLMPFTYMLPLENHVFMLNDNYRNAIKGYRVLNKDYTFTVLNSIYMKNHRMFGYLGNSQIFYLVDPDSSTASYGSGKSYDDNLVLRTIPSIRAHYKGGCTSFNGKFYMGFGMTRKTSETSANIRYFIQDITELNEDLVGNTLTTSRSIKRTFQVGVSTSEYAMFCGNTYARSIGMDDTSYAPSYARDVCCVDKNGVINDCENLLSLPVYGRRAIGDSLDQNTVLFGDTDKRYIHTLNNDLIAVTLSELNENPQYMCLDAAYNSNSDRNKKLYCRARNKFIFFSIILYLTPNRYTIRYCGKDFLIKTEDILFSDSFLPGYDSSETYTCISIMYWQKMAHFFYAKANSNDDYVDKMQFFRLKC